MIGRSLQPSSRSQYALLVAKSLVALDKSDPATRWYLLETIRAYAFEKLIECNEAQLVSRRHAEYFRDLATRLIPLSDLGFRTVVFTECFLLPERFPDHLALVG